MQITEAHAEWVTVHRMRDMLINVHDDYKVTHSYALFTTILCWVMQRVRANGQAVADQRARSVFDQLQREYASDDPWRIAEPDFQHLTAADFLLALRNATSHGDARNILPINEDQILVGHEFHCSKRTRDGRIIWEGRIVLKRRDMRRLGIALADRFCEALDTRPDFVEEARLLREEAL